MGYDILTLPPFSLWKDPVNTHPDMLLFPLANGFLTDKNYLEQNEAFFSSLCTRFFPAKEPLGALYPADVRFNVLSFGGTVYAGVTAAEEIVQTHKRHVTIRQGYARCSACVVGNGVITADPSLERALSEDGVPVLSINPGHIALSGYDYGFIGGASLTLSDSLTVFFGKLEEHPDYGRMKAFAESRGVTLLSLSDEPLTDCGGGYLCPMSL